MSRDLFSLAGQVALVTGASKGLGLAMAEAMAEAGATVALNGRSAETLAARVKEFEAKGLKASAAPFDVTDPEACKKGMADVIARHGKLDILICNAGNQHRKPLIEWELDDWHSLMNTHLTSAFVLGQAAAKHMIPRGTGRIIMIGSIMSTLARPTVHAYTAAKSGIWGLTRTMAAELGPKGILVAHVNIDGPINTGAQAARLAAERAPDGLLEPEAIAESYYQLHMQHRSAWTQELDVRPWVEKF